MINFDVKSFAISKSKRRWTDGTVRPYGIKIGEGLGFLENDKIFVLEKVNGARVF
jgi:hypothetical protein